VLLFSLIVAVRVFRFAFGAELPNPIDWLPAPRRNRGFWFMASLRIAHGVKKGQ
jgi:hypothetical protein